MKGLHDLTTGEFQPDIMAERMGLLEVSLGRAMARCGSTRGARILIDYLDDARRCLAEHAHDELADISGRDFGFDQAVWKRWLARTGPRLSLKPWRNRGE
jgi:hypothetical protein